MKTGFYKPVLHCTLDMWWVMAILDLCQLKRALFLKPPSITYYTEMLFQMLKVGLQRPEGQYFRSLSFRSTDHSFWHRGYLVSVQVLPFECSIANGSSGQLGESNLAHWLSISFSVKEKDSVQHISSRRVF